MNGMDAASGKALDGADHIRQSIAKILGTPIGTRVARREFGSMLPELLDQPMNDLLRIRLYAATALAITRQESRVRVARIALVPGIATGTATIRIEGRRTDTARPQPFAFDTPIRALSALAA